MIRDSGATGMATTLSASVKAGRHALTPDNPDDDPDIAFVKDVSNKDAIARTWVKA